MSCQLHAISVYILLKGLHSGSFIFNHYQEALEIISTRSAELVEIRKRLNIADGEFEKYLDEETTYLRGLHDESPEDTIHFDYVEALDDLSKCRYVSHFSEGCNHSDLWIDSEEWEAARAAVDEIAQTPGIANIYNWIVHGNRVVLSALTKHSNTDKRVALFENQLNLQSRWEPTSEEYKLVKGKVIERKYRRALDELEWLVVQQLFELTKMNMSGTGAYTFTFLCIFTYCTLRL
jgi:hypothetical protein